MPPRHGRWNEAADLLAARVAGGQYRAIGIPSERRLAVELGVSYLTARKAVQHLVDGGLLRRLANGRLAEAPAGRPAGLHLGFICPAFAGHGQQAWHRDLAQLVAADGGSVRPVVWTAPDDPALFAAFDADFDGLVAILPPVIGPLLRQRLVRHRTRTVVLWQDTSDLGVPSLDTTAPDAVGLLTAHLAGLGHTRIDFLNTQPHDQVAVARIAAWRAALAAQGLAGALHDEPVEPFADPAAAAYDLAHRLLAGGAAARAWICLTCELARGVLRACHERGVAVGRDLALAGFGELEVARLSVPSLTTVRPAERLPILAQGLDWIRSGGVGWKGSLRIAPAWGTLAVAIGESTANARIGDLP